MEINKCYVCLEECQGEQSPCECKTPIHHKCFVNLGDLEQCTICKKQYVTTQVIEEPQEHIIVVRKKPQTLTSAILIILMLFASWYFAGILGKAIWVIIGGTLKNNTYEFWNEEHTLASFGTIFFFMIIYCISCRKKQSIFAAA